MTEHEQAQKKADWDAYEKVLQAETAKRKAKHERKQLRHDEAMEWFERRVQGEIQVNRVNGTMILTGEGDLAAEWLEEQAYREDAVRFPKPSALDEEFQRQIDFYRLDIKA